MKKVTTSLVAASSAILLALTGCSSEADGGNSGGGGSGDSGDLATDVGVTDSEIKLAVQTDTSGAFKVTGLGLTHGNELWAKDVNAAGGICDREVVLDIKDNGYLPDKALPLYDQQQAENLGYMQLLGSPILAALKQKIINDQMSSVTASWASINLDAPEVIMIGQTYDVEIINGLAYAQEQGLLADGDKIGHIYIDSEYGQNGVLGSEYYAKEHNLEVVKVPIAATDTDMNATMTKLKSDGVKLLVITTAPAATGSTAVQNVAQGMNVPIIGSNPTFAPNLLTDPTVTAALTNYYQVNSILPYTADNPLAEKLRGEYEAGYQDQPSHAIFAGYVAGMVWGAILEKACDNGDMTRQGIIDAKSTVDSVDTQGLMGALDLTNEGAPTSREGAIMQADSTVADKGGLKVVEGFFESAEAKEYKTPHQK